jgi:hypothetical protein
MADLFQAQFHTLVAQSKDPELHAIGVLVLDPGWADKDGDVFDTKLRSTERVFLIAAISCQHMQVLNKGVTLKGTLRKYQRNESSTRPELRRKRLKSKGKKEKEKIPICSENG